MNIDLSKTDRNCKLEFFLKPILLSLDFFIVLGCTSKRKAVDPLPMRRKRTSSRMDF
jgi:hypothetical protein